MAERKLVDRLLSPKPPFGAAEYLRFSTPGNDGVYGGLFVFDSADEARKRYEELPDVEGTTGLLNGHTMATVQLGNGSAAEFEDMVATLQAAGWR